MRNDAKTIGSLLLLPLFVLVGCGGDDKNNNQNTGGSGGGNEVDDYAAKYVATSCAKAVECHRAETEAECIASSSAGLDEVAAHVANGTIIYHPEKGEACLAAIGKFNGCTFGELLPLLADGGDSVKYLCALAFEGTIGDGGDCTTSEQCASYSCEPVDPNCTNACCPGKCVGSMQPVPPPPAKIGQSCAMGPCESGAYCQNDPNTGAPTTCAARLAAGAACTQFDACELPTLCALNAMTGMGTCKKAPATGEACDPMDGPFACDRLDDNCDMTTMKCTTPGLIGATCADNNECVTYAHCNMATSKCVKDPIEGEVCDPMDNTCLGNLRCLETGKCGFKPATICK